VPRRHRVTAGTFGGRIGRMSEQTERIEKLSERADAAKEFL
jgi:hypothetical protein